MTPEFRLTADQREIVLSVFLRFMAVYVEVQKDIGRSISDTQKADIAAVKNLYELIKELPPVDQPDDRVPIPKNEEQAELMEKIGYAWLKEHAPHRLIKQPDAAEVREAIKRIRRYELHPENGLVLTRTSKEAGLDLECIIKAASRGIVEDVKDNRLPSITIEEAEDIITNEIECHVATSHAGQRHATISILAEMFPNGLRIVADKEG